MFRGVSNRRIVPYTRRGFRRGGQSLSLNLLYYANGSTRYITQGGIMTSFAAYEKATRWISGRKHIQLEGTDTVDNTYSEQIGTYAKTNVLVDDNTETDPLGNVTLDKIKENLVTVSAFYVSKLQAVTIGDYRVASAVVKAGERTNIAIQIDSGVDYYGQLFNLSTGAAISCPLYTGFEPDWSCILPFTNGSYFIAVGAQMPSTGNATFYLRLFDGTDGSYAGTIGYGIHAGFFNLYEGNHLTSYIQTEASPATRSGCEADFDAVDIPSWLRNGYRQYIYFDKEDSVMCAASGTKRVLTSWDATAGTIKIYIDGSDLRLKVELVGTGVLVQSAALSWSLNQNPYYSIEFDNGANCVLTTSGFTGGDGEVTGTSFAAADGGMSLGMNHTAYTEHACNLISELYRL